LAKPVGQQIQQAQIRLIYEHMGRGLRISVLVSLILAGLVWSRVPAPMVWGWELVLLGVLAWRYRQSQCFEALGGLSNGRDFPVGHWCRRLISSVLATGLCWGFAGSVFQFYIGNDLTTPLLILCMLALTVTAIPFLSHVMGIYLVYLYAITIPTGLALAYIRMDKAIEVVAMTAVYLWGIQFAARNYHRFIEYSLRLKWRAENLSQELTKSNQQLDEFFNNAPV